MISRKSIIDMIEVPAVSGGVQVRIGLQILDGDEVVGNKWHRTYIPADVSAAEQMAYVNEHLAQMGEAPLTSADIQRVGMFHRLSCELPSENAPVKSIEEAVAEIKEAKASTKVSAK